MVAPADCTFGCERSSHAFPDLFRRIDRRFLWSVIGNFLFPMLPKGDRVLFTRKIILYGKIFKVFRRLRGGHRFAFVSNDFPVGPALPITGWLGRRDLARASCAGFELY